MDYILEIIVSEKEMTKIELYEKMVEWEGEICPYAPRRFETKSKIIFEQVKYYESKVRRNLGRDMVILVLKSSLLFDLEYDANQKGGLIEKNKLAIFLDSLSQLEEFFIFLTREDEIVKEKYKIEEEGEIIEKLIEALNWQNPKDIFLYKRLKNKI